MSPLDSTFAVASPLAAAVDWFRTLLLGSTGTIVAILAVSGVGFLVLSGRLPVRRGAAVIFGCFILFSAATIAGALTGTPSPANAEVPAQASPPPPPPSPPPALQNYDPYAGASLRMQGQRDLLH